MFVLSVIFLLLASFMILTAGLTVMIYAVRWLKFLITTEEEIIEIMPIVTLIVGALGSTSILCILAGLKFAVMAIW
jgi:hypothetical protein